MPKVVNTRNGVVILPTGTIIDGETEVSQALLDHTDNKDYVAMLFRTGRLEIVEPKTKAKTKKKVEDNQEPFE